MQLQPRLRISPRLARLLHARFQQLGYKFVDSETKSAFLDSRVLEYSYVISELLKKRKGKTLDVGCTDTGNIVSPVLTGVGWDVYGIDGRAFKFEHSNFCFVLGDIRRSPFPNGFFDHVVAISSIEHIGLAGRFGVEKNEPDGDVDAVREISRILRPGGTLLLTAPYGKLALVKPLSRNYDKERLRKLFLGWRIVQETFYCTRNEETVVVSEEVAASQDYLKGERGLVFAEFAVTTRK